MPGKPPDFLVIGAQRCGTTSITALLRAHPEIFIPETASEPKFFAREEEYGKGEEYYRSRYFSSAGGRVCGEKSTQYMENRSAAGRIHLFKPSMKLICSLRHPVDRAISNYWYSVSNGLEKRGLNEALREEFQKYQEDPFVIGRLDSPLPHAYIYRGLYCDNLKSFYEHFPLSQIHCIIYEEFRKRPLEVFGQVFTFLGVSPVPMEKERIPRLRHLERKEQLDDGLRRELEGYFLDRNRNLNELTGRDVLGFWTGRDFS